MGFFNKDEANQLEVDCIDLGNQNLERYLLWIVIVGEVAYEAQRVIQHLNYK